MKNDLHTGYLGDGTKGWVREALEHLQILAREQQARIVELENRVANLEMECRLLNALLDEKKGAP